VRLYIIIRMVNIKKVILTGVIGALTLGSSYALTLNDTTEFGGDVSGTYDSISIDYSSVNVGELVNDAGYITLVDEEDQVFVASAASNIANVDITNWNNAFSWGDWTSEGFALEDNVYNKTEADGKFALVSQLHTPTVDTDTNLNESEVDIKQNVLLGSEAVFSSWDKNSSDDFSGDYNDLSNQPVIPVDTDTQLNEAQVDALVGNNGFAFISAVYNKTEADGKFALVSQLHTPTVDTDTNLNESEVDNVPSYTFSIHMTAGATLDIESK